jgi:hypothetical protein
LKINFICTSGKSNFLDAGIGHLKRSLILANELLFSFFPSWEIERLRGKIDLFVNFISFQEMEPDIVKNYLNIVSSLEPDVILLRNMKEGKQKATKATVGVISPIMSKDYGKFLPHYELVSSNIIPFGYTTMDDFNSELLLFKRK